MPDLMSWFYSLARAVFPMLGSYARPAIYVLTYARFYDKPIHKFLIYVLQYIETMGIKYINNLIVIFMY